MHYFIVNNTLHELYFDRVVIFWITYNKAPAELYLIQNITTWSKYNSCIVLFTIEYTHLKTSNSQVRPDSAAANERRPLFMPGHSLNFKYLYFLFDHFQSLKIFHLHELTVCVSHFLRFLFCVAYSQGHCSLMY